MTSSAHSHKSADAPLSASGKVPPVLSIITVTYNSAQEISGCLASLPSTLLDRPVEVILVDNCSTDGTLDLVRRDHPLVHAISAGSNVGFGAANNIAFGHSTGDYILFLNPDTIANTPVLEHCLRRLQSDASIGIISPRLVLANGEMDLACRRSVPTIWDGFTRSTGLYKRFPRTRLCGGYNMTYLPDDGTYPVGAVNGAFMMMPRALFSTMGGFDERFFMYGDDLDLCLRCAKHGYKVVYDGKLSMVHLKGRSSSKSTHAMSKALFKGTKQFYLKHFNPHNSPIVRFKYEFLFWLWQQAAAFSRAITGTKSVRPS